MKIFYPVLKPYTISIRPLVFHQRANFREKILSDIAVAVRDIHPATNLLYITTLYRSYPDKKSKENILRRNSETINHFPSHYGSGKTVRRFKQILQTVRKFFWENDLPCRKDSLKSSRTRRIKTIPAKDEWSIRRRKPQRLWASLPKIAVILQPKFFCVNTCIVVKVAQLSDLKDF